ncbi:hypothetical protein PUN28_011046 [Cardiocondyla obscurior]|uniref:Uncharacterized protein n=1 Tax=Cardiocondyla obscurior TaxID=286306 RepID=A0AAW2FKE4_9HYME
MEIKKTLMGTYNHFTSVYGQNFYAAVCDAPREVMRAFSCDRIANLTRPIEHSVESNLLIGVDVNDSPEARRYAPPSLSPLIHEYLTYSRSEGPRRPECERPWTYIGHRCEGNMNPKAKLTVHFRFSRKAVRIRKAHISSASRKAFENYEATLLEIINTMRKLFDRATNRN